MVDWIGDKFGDKSGDLEVHASCYGYLDISLSWSQNIQHRLIKFCFHCNCLLVTLKTSWKLLDTGIWNIPNDIWCVFCQVGITLLKTLLLYPICITMNINRNIKNQSRIWINIHVHYSRPWPMCAYYANFDE